MNLIGPNLLGMCAAGLVRFFEQRHEKPFRARQLLHWIHQRRETDFARMSDLAKPLREKLARSACVEAPVIVGDTTAEDGTRKWLLKVDEANAVEAVFIPETNRGTLCISSQAGCTLDCAFCSTGKQGFNRNLDNVIPALRLMLDDNAYGLSRRRVTVSTSSVIPGMDRLRDECPVALAVSLHAPNDALRDQLVPVNKKYPLRDLIAACNRYLEKAPRDFITFEYVMLDGVNDNLAHAKELVGLAKRVRSKFNLIPFNPFPKSDFRRSDPDRIRRFAEVLQSAGLTVTTRKTRGDDIAAACGQLAGEVADRTRRRATYRLKEVRA